MVHSKCITYPFQAFLSLPCLSYSWKLKPLYLTSSLVHSAHLLLALPLLQLIPFWNIYSNGKFFLFLRKSSVSMAHIRIIWIATMFTIILGINWQTILLHRQLNPPLIFLPLVHMWLISLPLSLHLVSFRATKVSPLYSSQTDFKFSLLSHQPYLVTLLQNNRAF